jgi:hypothetical protein
VERACSSIALSSSKLCQTIGFDGGLGLLSARDYSSFVVRKSGVRLLETNDPNNDLLPILKESTDRIAFSINNNHILQDKLLDAGIFFFQYSLGSDPEI